MSSRQVAPDGHAAEAQMLGDLSDGQALLAEEDRLGTVFVGEAVVAFQPCLPTQPVDRRAIDARLLNDLLDGNASAVQVDHLLALLRRQGPELRLLDAVDHTRRPWHGVGRITLIVWPLPHAGGRCGASSLQGLTFWLCRICPVRRLGLVRIAHRSIRPVSSRRMRYIGAGTHLAALTGGQLPSEVQQHHQVVRVDGAELYSRPSYSNIGAHLASVVETVDTATLKVAAYGRAGSSPAGGTTASLYKPSP